MNILKSCDCIEQINVKLAPSHQVEVGIGMPTASSKGMAVGRVLIRTTRISRGGKSFTLPASHCPWCGVKAAP